MQHDLRALYNSDKYTNLIEIFSNKSTNLELYTNESYVLIKTLEYLESKLEYSSIFNILKNISNYKNVKNLFIIELKDGISVLIKNKQYSMCIDFFILHLDNVKSLDEYQVLDVLKPCFSSINSGIDNSSNLVADYSSLINKSFSLIEKYYEKNNNFSHNFWQTTIEGFIKWEKNNSSDSNNNYSYRLLEMYPTKFSYSEALWKKVIVISINSSSSNNNTSNNSLKNIINTQNSDFYETFSLFTRKFVNRTKSEDYKAYEGIYNIFLEELSSIFEGIQITNTNNTSDTSDTSNTSNLNPNHKLLQESILEEIFITIFSKHSINIKSVIIEKVFVWIINSTLSNTKNMEKYNYNHIQRISLLIKYIKIINDLVNTQIINKIINHLYAYKTANNIKCIFSIVKLCKSKQINVPYEGLNLNENIYKDLFLYMSESEDISISNDSIFNSTSNSISIGEDNMNYMKEKYANKSGKESKSKKIEENTNNLIPEASAIEENIIKGEDLVIITNNNMNNGNDGGCCYGDINQTEDVNEFNEMEYSKPININNIKDYLNLDDDNDNGNTNNSNKNIYINDDRGKKEIQEVMDEDYVDINKFDY